MGLPVLFAWLLAGTMDIVAAIFLYAFPSGTRIMRLLQGIASGLIGAKAFSGGVQTAALGLVAHYVIALVWTIVGFVLLSTFKTLNRHLILAGVTYGVVVWAVMNLIVLPLSNVGGRPVQFVPSVIAATTLIFCIGLPIALVIGRQLRDARTPEW